MSYRNLAILLLLALSSVDAMAEWSKVARVTDASVYIDPGTIRRQGSVVRMWDMFDFAAAQMADGKKYLSFISLAEYDCKDQKSRPLRILAFTGNMGTGNMASSLNTAGPWAQVMPTSIEEWLWRRACRS